MSQIVVTLTQEELFLELTVPDRGSHGATGPGSRNSLVSIDTNLEYFGKSKTFFRYEVAVAGTLVVSVSTGFLPLSLS